MTELKSKIGKQIELHCCKGSFKNTYKGVLKACNNDVVIINLGYNIMMTINKIDIDFVN